MKEVVALEPGPWVGVCPRDRDRRHVGPEDIFICDYASPDQHWLGTGKFGDDVCTRQDYEQMKANFGKWGNLEGETPFPGFTRCPILNNVTAYDVREVRVVNPVPQILRG